MWYCTGGRTFFHSASLFTTLSVRTTRAVSDAADAGDAAGAAALTAVAGAAAPGETIAAIARTSAAAKRAARKGVKGMDLMGALSLGGRRGRTGTIVRLWRYGARSPADRTVLAQLGPEDGRLEGGVGGRNRRRPPAGTRAEPVPIGWPDRIGYAGARPAMRRNGSRTASGVRQGRPVATSIQT